MKKKLLIPLAGMMVLMMAGIAVAACTLDTTLSGTSWRGSSTKLNITCTMNNVSYCLVTGASTLTSDTLSYTVKSFMNTSGGGPYLNRSANGTFDSFGEVDASDWAIDATCYNQSGTSEAMTQVTSVTIDNTLPVITSASPSDATKYDEERERRSIDFSITCTNATSAILYINDVPHTMTESSDSCTFTKGFLSDGGYTWYTTASDGLNVTTGSSYTMTVSTPGHDEAGDVSSTGTGTMALFGGGTGGGLGGAGIVILAIAGYFLFFNKKGTTTKKRRK